LPAPEPPPLEIFEAVSSPAAPAPPDTRGTGYVPPSSVPAAPPPPGVPLTARRAEQLGLTTAEANGSARAPNPAYYRLRSRRRSADVTLIPEERPEGRPAIPGQYLRVHPVSLRHVEVAVEDVVGAMAELVKVAEVAGGGDAASADPNAMLSVAFKILGGRLLPLVGAASELWEGPEEQKGRPLDMPGVTVLACPVDLEELEGPQQIAVLAAWVELSFAQGEVWQQAGKSIGAVIEALTGRPLAAMVPPALSGQSPSYAVAGTSARTSTGGTTGAPTKAGAGRTSKRAPRPHASS
jgi:hypothetical protein